MEFKGTKGKWYTAGEYVTSAEEDICMVFLWDDPLERDEDTTQDEARVIHEANSKLIAHAPEMLGMLKRIMETYDKGTQTYIDCMELIKSATEVDNGN